jgi:hypothetical protein
MKEFKWMATNKNAENAVSLGNFTETSEVRGGLTSFIVVNMAGRAHGEIEQKDLPLRLNGI